MPRARIYIKAVPDPAWLTQPATRIEQAFAAFHAVNSAVYAELQSAALGLYYANARRIGVSAIVEKLRYDYALRTRGGAYKINNSFRALYARLLVHRVPELADVVELRSRREKAAA